MIAPKVFYIPEKTDYVVVSDMFVEDYAGGAELTLEAILNKAPGKVYKVHSMQVTADLVENNKDKIWILGNFSRMPKTALIELVASKVNYSVIECDYKYCKHRSAHLHKLQEGKDCDCHTQEHGIFIRAFYQRANKVFFMGEGQMNEYVRLFPQAKPTNFVVQTSTFKDSTLARLKELREQRGEREANPRWAIMSGGSWIKAEKQTIEWCESQGMEYELIGGLTHSSFLEKLSTMKGLVFRPAGYDTCPRLVIEAKLLGLELKLNENVQHKDEAWFSGSIEEAENYLKDRAETFWKTLNG